MKEGDLLIQLDEYQLLVTEQGPYPSTILRLFLTWLLCFSQAFTNLN